MNRQLPPDGRMVPLEFVSKEKEAVLALRDRVRDGLDIGLWDVSVLMPSWKG